LNFFFLFGKNIRWIWWRKKNGNCWTSTLQHQVKQTLH